LSERSRFLPVEIVAQEKAPVATPVAEKHIEIKLVGGHLMRMSGGNDAAGMIPRCRRG
jgi:transposase